ncbi:acetylglutamate kinase [Bernardetia sp. OM2101]|uniref:acetylglutamate kinase n=1 Tax=Bernardetia sp. OM2101 TaxID=3344876 RepID=UPI0035D03104
MKKQLYIIKIGGNCIDNPNELDTFLENFACLSVPKILIHGGGKIATQISQKLGIVSKLVEGRRITSKEELEVVTMVYAGLINKKIVATLQSKNCNALGLSGADANTILAKKRPVKNIDYGFVGDIEEINTEIIDFLLQKKTIPVFSAITHDKKGTLLNTNADTIASSLAVALSQNYETTLIYCFEKKGVLRDTEDENSIISTLKLQEYEELKKQEIIYQGMIPKLDNCFDALQKGVQKVIISNIDFIKNTDLPHTEIHV